MDLYIICHEAGSGGGAEEDVAFQTSRIWPIDARGFGLLAHGSKREPVVMRAFQAAVSAGVDRKHTLVHKRNELWSLEPEASSFQDLEV